MRPVDYERRQRCTISGVVAGVVFCRTAKPFHYAWSLPRPARQQWPVPQTLCSLDKELVGGPPEAFAAFVK